MPVYEDEQDKSDSQNRTPEDEELRRLTGINGEQESAMDREARRGAADDTGHRTLYNPNDRAKGESAPDGKAVSPGGLAAAESSGASGKGNSLYNPDEGAKAKPGGGFRAAAKGLIGKKKLLMGLGAGAGLGVIPIILLAVFLLGLFKIPDFAQNITTYQFVRATRNMSKNAEKITAEKMAIDSVEDDSTWGKIKATYTAKTGKVADTWAQFDKYRPNKTISNLGSSDAFKLNYQPSRILHRPQLVGVTIGDRSVPVAKLGLSKYIPGQQTIADTRFASQVAPALRDALHAADIGPIIRGVVAHKIRQQLGIGLIAWDIGKYKGLSEKKARLQVEKDSYAKVNDTGGTGDALSHDLQAATADAQKAQDGVVNNATELQKFVDSGEQVPKPVQDALAKDLTQTGLDGITKKVIGAINQIYGVAVPMCIIYDGSLQNSKASMNAQNAALQRSYYLVASAADQEKDGTHATGEAVGAMNWKLGNISQSPSELRAGGKPVDTSKYASVQASSVGQFSIADALFPSPLDTIMNHVAGACPAMTNPWVGASLGVGNIVISIVGDIFSGGAPTGVEVAAEGAAKITMKRVTDSVVENITKSGILTQEFYKTALLQASATAGATFLAQYIVMNQMGATHSGLPQGMPFDVDADNGGNLAANSIEQQGLYGRPMTNSEVALSAPVNQQFLADQTKSKSAFQRYLAMDNAGSLLARTASMTAGKLNGSTFSSFLSLGGQLLNPVRTIGSVFSTFGPKPVLAAAGADTSNYGNVQWGWSNEEESLIDSDPSYSPLENQKALDDSGQEDAISQKYGVCFDGSKQMGDLLTTETGQGGVDKYYIVRDNTGNVIANQGLCSPDNLGPNNPEGFGDLVFRWRVAQGYKTTMDQLIGIQDVSASAAP